MCGGGARTGAPRVFDGMSIKRERARCITSVNIKGEVGVEQTL